jgi:hypothetical protein
MQNGRKREAKEKMSKEERKKLKVERRLKRRNSWPRYTN